MKTTSQLDFGCDLHLDLGMFNKKLSYCYQVVLSIT